MNLFIVESPTKAKSIAKYLGNGWVVRATLGHIKDLPERELGVDIKTLEPKYVWLKGKKKIVDGIKKAAKKAKKIYLGTDPDREGEAIAYFLKEELLKVNTSIYRATFYEITKKAITEAIGGASDINLNLVSAQFSRRVLDRLIGYKLSPFLWRDLKERGLSVGRVQSPTLRLIVERERQIQNFKRKKYYYIKAEFVVDGVEFSAVFKQRFEKPSNAEPFMKKLKDVMFVVKSVSKEMQKEPPPKPFNTVSLQAEASKILGISVDKVQKMAQKLYEEGLITYPRTDSYRMNKEKAQEFMKYIERTYGKDYVGRLRKYKEKALAWGAHECIRPTSLDKKPESVLELKLWSLISSRALASLSSDAIREKFFVVLLALSDHTLEFTAEGSKLVFDGWTRIYPKEVKDRALPHLEEGQVIKPKRIYIEEVEVPPPPRYTEGSLVRTLENLGIGRPSTYATIIKTLKDRGYVVLEKGYLKPTEMAFKVVDYLMEKFPNLMDYGFTKYMEDNLDAVEEGKKDWKEVVRESYRRVLNAKE
ncbi:DNA topoisomerase I [Hydrogenobacter thermophilus TK-6]|uniref:DNA topoisomerase 1 n=1 Tax=Hydrogenobacter thermophilus (strain DSM 6534 / IAM 12695 / TK-6) TaxID=608538 RepID=D3DGK1_HYDTT|nr:type I DNA topoisomerase [Hydrogenobacter thermophilus]ADO44888.1 DNA topoisomerase I [Hydrogenobacter thermophilus TK-6]BAI68953.1 DNA topoisomerase I [Hydrogenobacter thermophilus TK-6]